MASISVLPRRTADPNRTVARVARSAARHLAEFALPDRGCCLTFHRAVRAADWAAQPNRGFHLDLHYLERLIVHLQRTGWDIVSMDEAISRAAQPGSGRFVNFSVDDCYNDTAELVVPLFRRLRAPVTLFVTTGIPDATLRLRDAGLESILLAEERVDDDDISFTLDSPASRRAAFAALSRKWDGPHGDAAYLQFCARHHYDPDALDQQHRITWAMLDALCHEPLVEIGAHTVSHARIAGLDEAAARAELAGSRDRLEAVVARPVRHFAFPYGRSGDCGARDFALARDVGFASAATTGKGLLGPGADPFRLPRNTINGTHRRLHFAYAHLTGASGLATRIMHRG